MASLLIGSTAYSAPSLAVDFAGIGQTAYSPPDPMIAAGPSNIIAIANSAFTIYTKSGLSGYSNTLANWFAPVSPPGTPFQPKIVYDPNGGHWVMLALASGNPKRSSYLVSVSSNSNPVGIWFLWNLDAGLDQNTASGNTADSPGLGYDDDAIYITSNQYDSHNNFQYAKLRIIAKSQLYNGGNVTWYDFWNQTNANGVSVFGWKPAQAQTSLKGNYLIDTRPNGSNYVTLWKVTNPLSTNPAPTLTREATLTVQSYSLPGNAAQQGGITTISTGDCRAQELQFQNGKLVTAFTEGYDWGGGAVSALRTLVLNPSNNSVEVDNRFGSDQVWYYYPAIARDPAGNMAMVFNRSAANEFVSARYTAWLSGEATWETSSILKTGEGFYSNGGNPWGSYTGAALDPSEPGHAWVYAEYAASANQWGTWIGEIPFPSTITITNDQCTGAVVLTNGVPFSMSTSAATSTNDPTVVCGSAASNGVWFAFTPVATGPVLISTCGSDFGTVLQVSGGTCAALTPVACNSGNGPACSSGQASVRFDGAAGTTYLLFAGGVGGASGNLTITADSPANDQCAGAIALTAGTPYSINTSAAGSFGDPSPDCGSGVTNGVWFTFTPNITGEVLLGTCGSDFDTVLEVYNGNCGSLTSVACNDNNGLLCGGVQASLGFFGTAGTSYLIFAGGSGGASGNLTIEAFSPGNDLCAGALFLPAFSSYTLNTSSAGSDGDPTDICGFSVGKGVWFTFSPPSDGKATISTCGSDFATVVQVYSGTCDLLTEEICDTGNDCSGTGTTLQFSAFSGTNYQIFVAGLGGASGNLIITNRFCQPPKITGGFTNTILTTTGIVVSATLFVSGTPPFNVNWSDGPLSTNTGGSLSVTFLIPLDQVPNFMEETNFSAIFVNVQNDCGGDGGSGGFPSPCVVCLSRGVPVTSSTTVTTGGIGPNLPTPCGNLGPSAKWFDMAAANSGAADVSVLQDANSGLFVSVFAGFAPNTSAVACDKRISDRQARVQFLAETNQHYYLVVTNGATVTNMTFGFVPQLSAVSSNGQFQVNSGIGPLLSYTLQAAATIADPMAWSNLFSAIFPTNGLSYPDLEVTNLHQRFYRISPGP